MAKWMDKKPVPEHFRIRNSSTGLSEDTEIIIDGRILTKVTELEKRVFELEERLIKEII